jgi:hypothetical protein
VLNIDSILQKHLTAPHLSRGCVVAVWAAGLPNEDQDALNDLKTKAVVVADLYRDLRAAGVPFKLTAFRSHMRGYCACPKM